MGWDWYKPADCADKVSAGRPSVGVGQPGVQQITPAKQRTGDMRKQHVAAIVAVEVTENDCGGLHRRCPASKFFMLSRLLVPALNDVESGFPKVKRKGAQPKSSMRCGRH
jgi:hypothetical protein